MKHLYAALLASALLVSGASATASPNETCADQAVINDVLAYEKDNSDFGKNLKNELRLVRKVIGPDFGLTALVSDLRRKGLEKTVSDWIDSASNQDFCGQPTCGPREQTKHKLAETFAWTRTLPALYDDYFTKITRPVAVAYDRDIDRVVCRFTYQINVYRAVEWMKQTNQDKGLIAAMEAVAPLQRDLDSTFAVQPDGRGGRAVEVKGRP